MTPVADEDSPLMANALPVAPTAAVVQITPSLADGNRQLEESVRRQAEFLAALNQTTLELLGRRNVPELLQALVDRAASLLRSPHRQTSPPTSVSR
jgi:hypothetical protein